MRCAYLHQVERRAVQLPVRGDVTAVLVAVGVSEHDFLQVAAAGDQRAVGRQAQQPVHHRARAPQVVDGLEERRDVEVQGWLIGGPRPQQPRLAQQHGRFEDIAHRVGVRDDAGRQRRLAETALDSLRCVEDRKFLGGEFAVGNKRRAQQARGAQFRQQERDLRFLIQLRIVRNRARARRELRHHRFVHAAVLAQVDRREVKAKGLRRMAQAHEPAIDHARAAVSAQRLDHRVEVLHEFRAGRIGPGGRQRAAQRIAMAERKRGSGKARVHAGQRAPVRLVAPLFGSIVRRIGQALESGRYVHALKRQAQLAAERVGLLQVVGERERGLSLHRVGERCVRDEGIAVAVPADPAAHAQHLRRGQAAAIARVQLGVDLFGEARDRREEGVGVKGQRVVDLVLHGEARRPQHARLPEDQDHAPQPRLVGRGLFGCLAHAVALIEQARDLDVGIEDALSLHLGRMRGKHRHYEAVGQELGEFGRGDAGCRGSLRGERNRSALRFRAPHPMRAAAADVVAVLGDVGELGELREGAHDGHHRVRVQRSQRRGKRRPGAWIAAAVELDRRAPDTLDQFESRNTFLLAQGVTEHAPEPPDVFRQRLVLACGLYHYGLRRFHSGIGSTGSALRYASGQITSRRPLRIWTRKGLAATWPPSGATL